MYDAALLALLNRPVLFAAGVRSVQGAILLDHEIEDTTVLSKRLELLTQRRSVTSHKTCVFSGTALRTSNLAMSIRSA
jgi:hypothetical protein